MVAGWENLVELVAGMLVELVDKAVVVDKVQVLDDTVVRALVLEVAPALGIAPAS